MAPAPYPLSCDLNDRQGQEHLLRHALLALCDELLKPCPILLFRAQECLIIGHGLLCASGALFECQYGLSSQSAPFMTIIELA